MTQAFPGSLLARITVEAASPMSIGAGGGVSHDVALSRDANGLPCLPPTALRGNLLRVWRHYFEPESGDTPRWQDVFGFEHHGTDEGQAGRVCFGFGYAHDCKGVAVTGLRVVDPDSSDEVLGILAADAPILRDHVGLNHRHTADGPAKFDRSAAPSGTRWSFDLRADFTSAEEKAWAADVLGRLVALLKAPDFRLGGRTAAGYGRILVRSAKYRSLLWRDPGVLRTVRTAPPSDHAGFEELKPAPLPEERLPSVYELKVQPYGFLRVGSSGAAQRTGMFELTDAGQVAVPRKEADKPAIREKDADLIPYAELAIKWDKGKFDRLRKAVPLVPGSSIAGPLAHRTLFHANRLKGGWADSPQTVTIHSERNADLETLFGNVKGRNDGQAGLLLYEDARIENAKCMALDHNAIDAFSGGVRTGAFYSEEVLVGGQLTFSILLCPSRRRSRKGVHADAIRAFEMALDDLSQGRLALGAKSYGYVQGTWTKSATSNGAVEKTT